MHADRVTHPVMGSWDAQPVRPEGLAGGADGVESVGLGAVFGLAGRAIELDHPPPEMAQHDGQAAAEAGRAFDDPGPFGVHAVAIDQLDGVSIAVCGGWEPALGEHAGRAGVDDGEGDPIAVGIDADHVMDEFCKHDGGTSDVDVSVGAGLGGTATPGL